MNVVISAHFDIARPTMFMKLDENNLNGLVDNFAGVFVSYQLSRETGVPVYFTNYEELDYDGADSVAKSLEKDTLVIVVDTILEQAAHGKLCSITNTYALDNYWEKLKSEFKNTIYFIDGFFEKTEDETWIYGNKYGFKSFYFGVPIPGTYYHSEENKVSLRTIDSATQVLINLIQWFEKK